MTLITRDEFYVPNTKGEIIRTLANCFQMRRSDLLPMPKKRLIAIYCAKMQDKIYQVKKRLGRELSCL